MITIISQVTHEAAYFDKAWVGWVDGDASFFN